MRNVRRMVPAVGARLALAPAFASTLSASALAKAPAVKVAGVAPVVGGRVVFEPKAPRMHAAKLSAAALALCLLALTAAPPGLSSPQPALNVKPVAVDTPPLR